MDGDALLSCSVSTLMFWAWTDLPGTGWGRLNLSLGCLLLKSSAHESPFSCAAKSRAIAIPVDLDSQVNNLFLKSHNIVQKTAMNWRLTARNAARRDSVLAASRDYRNIIERLQVMPGVDGRGP